MLIMFVCYSSDKPRQLHRVKFADDELKSTSTPELGFFKDPSAHELVDKARDMRSVFPDGRVGLGAWVMCCCCYYHPQQGATNPLTTIS